jgi:hypothetical protein
MSLFRNLIEHLDNDKIKEINQNIYDLNKNNDEYWSFLLENIDMDSSLILDNIQNIDIKQLIRKRALPKEIIDNEKFQLNIYNKHLENYLIRYQNISISYLEKIIKYKSDVNWDYICQYQDLTIDFMNKYKKLLNWNLISEFQLLSIHFIANNINNINWNLIEDNLKTRYLYNDSFIKLFSNKSVWNCMIWSNKVTNEFLIDNIDKLSVEGLNDLFRYKILDSDTLSKVIEKIKNSKNNNIKINKKMINSIIEGQEAVKEDFINDNLEHIDFDNLVSNQKLDLKFLYKHKEHVSLKQLSFNDDFNEEMLMDIYPFRHEYKEDFDWNFISKYIDLSKETVAEIKEIDKEMIIINDLLNN